MKRMSDLSDVMLPLIDDLNGIYHPVKYLQCDNAGENKKLEKKCQENGLGIIFEYTPLNSPQYNDRLERKISTLFTWVHSNLNAACLSCGLQRKLWAECANVVTQVENVIAHFQPDREPIIPLDLFQGKMNQRW